jgi:septum site-determining protein MinD
MDKKTYAILTASQKGGVGKSIVALNIAAALRIAGYEVLIIDTDVANPSIGPLLGLREMGGGYTEIIKGKLKFEDAQTVSQPAGFYVLPAGGDGESEGFDNEEINGFFAKALKQNFDFVIVDTPPGSYMDGILKNFNEALIITTPEETSVYGAQRLSQIYGKYHLNHKLVINRVKEDKFELDQQKIEQIYGDIAYGMLPEDKIVPESEIKHVPAYMLNRKSLFALSIDYLCRPYMLRMQGSEEQAIRRGGIGDVKKFFGLK